MNDNIKLLAKQLRIPAVEADETHAMAWGIELYLSGRYDEVSNRDSRVARELRIAIVNAEQEAAE
mgnify:CR=1 FL=1